jgi:hypothetical protein
MVSANQASPTHTFGPPTCTLFLESPSYLGVVVSGWSFGVAARQTRGPPDALAAEQFAVNTEPCRVIIDLGLYQSPESALGAARDGYVLSGLQRENWP